MSHTIASLTKRYVLTHKGDNTATLKRAQIAYDATSIKGDTHAALAVAISTARAAVEHPTADATELLRLSGLPEYSVSKGTLSFLSLSYALALDAGVVTADAVAEVNRSVNRGVTKVAFHAALIPAVASAPVEDREALLISGARTLREEHAAKKAAQKAGKGKGNLGDDTPTPDSPVGGDILATPRAAGIVAPVEWSAESAIAAAQDWARLITAGTFYMTAAQAAELNDTLEGLLALVEPSAIVAAHAA